MVGYCAPGSLGRYLMEGDKEVRIFGETYPVNARVEIIAGYSAHADYKELIKFLSCQERKSVKNIFLVHGEENAKKEFKTKLIAEGFEQVEIAGKGKTYELN